MEDGDAIISTIRELDRDLVVVDVGCRWGFADAFVKDLDAFHLYGFDPDKEECDRLACRYDSNRITLVPFGLADREGKSTLHLTKEPACSSLYEPDRQLTENYPALDCARKVNEIEIELTTLDLWAERSGVEYIDHIKIDTQGSELLVLNGASKALEHVRTIELEVEFNPIYKEQPLFADVDIFLRKQGFVLWKLTNLVHYGCDGENTINMGEDRLHHDHRSQAFNKFGGQLFWADAHYVRADIAQFVFTSHEQLKRDIALLICLNHLDLVGRLRQVSNSLNLPD